MKSRILPLSLVVGVGLLLLAGRSAWTEETQVSVDEEQGIFDPITLVSGDDLELPQQEGVEPQLKGAVHEAFAQAVTEPKPGPVVPKEPPADIEEMPPAEKPEGDDFIWLSGYWDFDEERDDFVWISGIYRKPPLRRHWISGSWVKVDGGWQRQRGLWAPLDQDSITFLPPPPEPKVEPQEEQAPDENSFYVPGYWEFKNDQYAWHVGYWHTINPGWIWVPAHYVWTPCGYVFCPGHWDKPLDVRGLLFAPVCIDYHHLKPGFVYTPSYVVHDVCLQDALFIKPGCGYFFGNYFKKPGYTCWPDHCVRGKICDPLFSFYRCKNRNRDKGWESKLRNLYTGRNNGTVTRPPSTLAGLAKLVKDFKKGSGNKNTLRNNVLAAPLSKLNKKVVHLKKLDRNQLLRHKNDSDQRRRAGNLFGQQQGQLLKKGGGQIKSKGTPRTLRINLFDRNRNRSGGNNGGNRIGGGKIGGNKIGGTKIGGGNTGGLKIGGTRIGGDKSGGKTGGTRIGGGLKIGDTKIGGGNTGNRVINGNTGGGNTGGTKIGGGNTGNRIINRNTGGGNSGNRILGGGNTGNRIINRNTGGGNSGGQRINSGGSGGGSNRGRSNRSGGGRRSGGRRK